MNPLPQLRGPLTGWPVLSQSTTKDGRFWFSDPRPYVTHEPSAGRPATLVQVFIWHTPPEWLMPFVQHELMTAMSSRHSAMLGTHSDAHSPLWPCCFHVRGAA